jgi:FAD/FMN-containing dehydrogenase
MTPASEAVKVAAPVRQRKKFPKRSREMSSPIAASETRARVAPATVESLRSALRGQILTPDSAEYDAARTVWNGMVDKRPALVAKCRGAADVIAMVNFARASGLPLSVRGGGHNVAGLALCDAGVTIDLSLMRGIRVAAEARTVRAEGGVTWGELDRETLAFGLATTGGMVSTTGIAGLTLGGGLGWQMARHGLASDNLLSVDIVTADGRLLTASSSEHEDLFWAVRGGGGNFGVVTSFEYRVHPMGSSIIGGMVLYPMDQARNVLRFYREYSAGTPDDLTVFAGLLTTPDGHDVVALMAAWFGPINEAAKHLDPIRKCGTPVADMIGPMSYPQLQTMFDAATPAGLRRYWKSGYFPAISDDLIDTVLKHAVAKTSPYSFILILRMHGKAMREAPDATAFGARAEQWDFDIIPQWQSPAEDAKHIEWARRFWSDAERFTRGVYSNHLDTDDGAPRVRAAYGRNYERLAAIKRRYDPDNLFKVNHNILPAV